MIFLLLPSSAYSSSLPCLSPSALLLGLRPDVMPAPIVPSPATHAMLAPSSHTPWATTTLGCVTPTTHTTHTETQTVAKNNNNNWGEGIPEHHVIENDVYEHDCLINLSEASKASHTCL